MTLSDYSNTQQETPIVWPPHYRLKKHRRAKHVRLRINRLHGLEITIPYRFNLRDIPDILEEKKSWIIKQLYQHQNSSIITRPTEIDLQALHEHWKIDYIKSEKRLLLTEHPFEKRIILTGKLDDDKHCLKLINAWLKIKAKHYLSSALNTLSHETNLTFTQISVRAQKTLWGSCTTEKKINLNYRLILLPAELARHVMLHELCHTKHLNHSKRFWQLVARYDIHWHANNKALRHADDLLPTWCHLV